MLQENMVFNLFVTIFQPPRSVPSPPSHTLAQSVSEWSLSKGTSPKATQEAIPARSRVQAPTGRQC